MNQSDIEDALGRGICSRCQRDCVGPGCGVTPSDATCVNRRCDWQPPTLAEQVRRILALAAPTAKGGTECQCEHPFIKCDNTGCRCSYCGLLERLPPPPAGAAGGEGYLSLSYDALSRLIAEAEKQPCGGGSAIVARIIDEARGMGPMRSAGAAGGGSGDLGALSAGARQKPDAGIEEIAARYAATGKKAIEDAIATQRPAGPGVPSRCIHCDAPLTAEEREFYSTGCERCMSKFHAAMVAEDLSLLPSAPTPDLGAQGEPVAWLYEVLPSWRDWAPIVSLTRPEETYRTRNIRPLYEAPAAPRTGSGVSVEEIARTIYSVWPNGGVVRVPTTEVSVRYRDEFRADSWDEAPDRHADCLRAAEQILTLFAQAPRDGGETQGGWRLVPEEPTEAMLSATRSGYWHLGAKQYERLLAAAPAPPSGVETIRQDSEGAADE